MIDFTNLFGGEQTIFAALFKSFAVLGSIMYLVYAIIIIRQTTVMLRALEESHGGFIKAVSWLQLFVAIVLIILALTIL